MNFIRVTTIIIPLMMFLTFCSGTKEAAKEESTLPTPLELELQNKQQEVEKKNVEILDLKSAIAIQEAEMNEMLAEREQLNRKINELEEQKTEMDSTQRVLMDSLSHQRENLESLIAAFEQEKQLTREIIENIKSSKDTVVVPETTVVFIERDLIDTSGHAGYQHTGDISDQEFRARYDAAKNLYFSKQPEKAIGEFHALIDLWPTHPLADNCQYWAGECFYSMSRYDRAIGEFRRVFTFEDSNKYDAALLKIGLCYLKTGNRDRALDAFKELEEKFPDSNLVDKAYQYISQGVD